MLKINIISHPCEFVHYSKNAYYQLIFTDGFNTIDKLYLPTDIGCR